MVMNIWTTLYCFIPVATVATFGYKWLLQATDVGVRYNWSFKGTQSNATDIHPNIQIRNHSKSRSYVLGSIEYRIDGQAQPICIDNKSLWDKDLKPGCIQSFDAIAPVNRIKLLSDVMNVQVLVRSQTGRAFTAQGPGQMPSRLHRTGLFIRQKLNQMAVPVD